MNKISSLPTTIETTGDKWIKRILDQQEKFLNATSNTIFHGILEEHISTWKTEHSPDISHFHKVLYRHPNYKDLIARVLYECMEKNATNIAFIKSWDINLKLKRISKEKYPDLHNLVSSTNLDYVKDSVGIIRCLELLQKTDIINSIRRSIVTLKPTRTYTYRCIDLQNKLDLKIINYLLRSPDLYNMLCLPPALDKLTTNNNLLHELNFYLYLFTDSVYNNSKSLHIVHILKNLDVIFTNRQDKLSCLTGLYLFALKYPSFQVVNDVYMKQFPDEFKVLTTLSSLGITDFKTVITNVLNTSLLQNIEPVELPSL